MYILRCLHTIFYIFLLVSFDLWYHLIQMLHCWDDQFVGEGGALTSPTIIVFGWSMALYLVIFVLWNWVCSIWCTYVQRCNVFLVDDFLHQLEVTWVNTLPHNHWQPSPIFTLRPAQSTTEFLALVVPFLDISYTWNRTDCVQRSLFLFNFIAPVDRCTFGWLNKSSNVWTH